MEDSRKELIEEIRETLEGRKSPGNLWEAMERGRTSRSSLMQTLELDAEEFKERNRDVKTRSTSNPSIVSEFASQVERNGGKVYFAKEGKDANKYIVDLCKHADAKLVVKSKSLTSEEIFLNHDLEANGIKTVETDLGELICQVAKEKPSHLVFPAAHRTGDQIAQLFSKEYGEDISSEPSDILSHVRAHLRPIFLSADVGITGANIGVAETGTIIVETNEGNGRLVSSIPKIHVVIIGLEKIVKSWEDVAPLIPAHTVSATGQRMTVYVSMISSHVPLGGDSEKREFHVIILDNGRSKMRDDSWYSDALNCIRCGACMNICPTYGIVGGHVFGYVYPGPIGVPWTANVHGVDKATFSHLCISCGLCKEICPVDIDIPMMIAKVKQEEIRQNGQLLVNSFFASSERVAKLASATAPLSNWLVRRSSVRWLMEKTIGVDKRRTLPEFSRKRLRDRIKEARDTSSGEKAKTPVVYFPDIYADYNDPELGIRAIKLLQRAGCSVEVPEVMWSGMPYVSYGEVEKASRVAKYNVQLLKRYVDQGYEIVSTEPTAAYMLKDMYLKLAEGEDSKKVAKKSHGYFEFLESSLGKLGLRRSMQTSEPIGFHIPCHERALTSGRPAIRFLETAGYKVKVVETGTCCGMAGTFGMKHGPLGYDLSMAVGEKLFQRFRESGTKVVATESSVCATQLGDGLDLKILHPLYMVEI